jgi:hypothetical protein
MLFIDIMRKHWADKYRKNLPQIVRRLINEKTTARLNSFCAAYAPQVQQFPVKKKQYTITNKMKDLRSINQ